MSVFELLCVRKQKAAIGQWLTQDISDSVGLVINTPSQEDTVYVVVCDRAGLSVYLCGYVCVSVLVSRFSILPSGVCFPLKGCLCIWM